MSGPIFATPRESNGGVPVNIQDQTSGSIDSYFNRELGSFTLASDTVASGLTTLNYVFEAAASHGLAPGSEILLLDVAGDVALQAVVIGVSTNTISIDRPIDHAFPVATTLGRLVSSNMNVDGSSTPVIYTYRAGAAPNDITRYILTMLGSTAMDDGKFGDLAALTRGLILRIYNGVHLTVFNFKTNLDIKQFCYDVNYAEKAPAGNTGLTARMTFGGQDKHGVVHRISGSNAIQWIVQDDLRGLDRLKSAVEGHHVTD
jgi:hypothetical protein